MESLAVLPHLERPENEPRLELLLADDDAELRSLLASRARDAIEAVAVLEAQDGADALQLALQRRPRIALLHANMPRLGGIEVAVTLRELQPQMRLALYTADPRAHRQRAREQRLPLFAKLELDRAVRWLELQALACADVPLRSRLPQKLSLECSACGYGVARPTAPERCPMCQGEGTWIHTPWRPFGRSSGDPL
jgi:CheY-like chemotaxis protein